jgi:hypothetical protein
VSFYRFFIGVAVVAEIACASAAATAAAGVAAKAALSAAASGAASSVSEQAGNSCVSCHAGEQSGFGSGHAFAATACTSCHAGDSGSAEQALAHTGLIAFPGNLDNARQSCGTCHAGMVDAVERSLMHTGAGVVHSTRQVIDGEAGPAHTQSFQSLGDTVADSLLRKQCASCHLGQPKTAHAVNPTTDRGGGCLACHIGEQREGEHPRLSREISVGRCFGCHSRSSRISLSFTGLAEVDAGDLRLADRRTVARMPADHHYSAGMVCTDCHGMSELKGHSAAAQFKRKAVTAQCTDCHLPHEADTNHSRLSCASCHSQWAPQCYGCHLEFDETGEQWDHVDGRVTPGAWHDQRWDIRNQLPPLGVTEDDRVEPFVPGMIMTIAHPDWETQQMFRLFAPISPHTIGESRSCASCHRSSEALGLGQGALRLESGVLHFAPARELREDGLPADAWTNLGSTLGGRAPREGQRPFTLEEMLRIFSADIQQDSLVTGGSGSASSASSPSNTGGTNSTSGLRSPPAPRSPTK